MNLLNKLYKLAIGGAVLTGVIWAIGWGLAVGGGLFEVFIDPRGEMIDMWPQAMAIPGFFGGVFFYCLFIIAEGRNRFDELLLPRFAAWGVISGLLLGVIVVLTGVASFLFVKMWLQALVIISASILFSVILAVISALLFRFIAGDNLSHV